jgi:predicted membrane chloride channel (bestrophin family)
MVIIQYLAQQGVKIAFSIQGHALMTLLISYLVVAKINISYDRYMKARYAVGTALSRLRELHQIGLTYTFSVASAASQQESVVQPHPSTTMVQMWRRQLTERVVDLMDCTIRIIRNPLQAEYLARNDHSNDDSTLPDYDDPHLHVQALRLHLCHGSVVSQLEVLERIKFMDMMNDFCSSYRELLVLASTPLPFPLLQMARTFLFLWTFSLPFVLRGVVEEALVSYVFVFFLTYGFIGLELVSVRLVHPFGDDDKNDLNVLGMRDATLRGMQKDWELFGESCLFLNRDRRLEFHETKARIPTLSTTLYHQRSSRKHVIRTTTVESNSTFNHQGGADHQHHHYMAMGIV